MKAEMAVFDVGARFTTARATIRDSLPKYPS